jgi:SAM-dependent methyltransferase
VISRDFEHECTSHAAFLVCGECGLVVQTPPATPEDLLRAYPDDYHAYHEYANPLMMRLKRRYYARRARAYGKMVGSAAAVALDVGCSDGNFMVELQRLHPRWNVRGVDFNPRVVEQGRGRGLTIYTGTLEDVPCPAGTFDLLVMNHMIEHAFDPLATLVRCATLLKPGGLLVGETPSVDCWDFALFGGYWGGLHAPRHTMLFSPATLSRAAGAAGLEVVWIRHALQPAHIALSAQHWLQSRRGTRVRLRRGRAFYYPYLMLAMLPLAAVQVLRRRSGVITFAFRRPAAT